MIRRSPRFPPRLQLRRLVALAAPVGCALVVALAGRAQPPTRTVLEVRGTPVELAAGLAAVEGPGARIRLGGRGFALIEVDAEALAAVEARFPARRRLLVSADPFVLVQVRESELASGAALDRFTIYRDAGADLRVLALPAADYEALAAEARAAPAARVGPLALALGAASPMPLPKSVAPAALAPLAAAARAHPYRQSRLAEPTARARARALAGQVDAARIERIVRDLSTGPGATRYSGRPEINTFARDAIADTLRAIFSAAGDTVIVAPFAARVDADSVTLYNVIARRPGERPGSGRYVIGGHYDSIAHRTAGWNPATDPAPGADDNASGTASVIEAARVLMQSRYDFDLEFILFSGEEQVLLGSKAYTADSSLAALDEVLGVIILDMVGYNPRAADSLNVLTNLTSEWLADLMREAEEVLAGEHGLDDLDKVVQPTFNFSDHAPFWSTGRSAVLLIENTDVVAHNPHYHRVTDTADPLLAVDGFDLMRRATEVVVATLGQFALTAPAPPAPFTLPAVLVFDEAGGLTVEAVVGERLEARARVLNSGPARPGPVEVSAVLRVGGRPAAALDTVLAAWGRGEWHEVILPWTAAAGQIGGAGAVEVELALVEDEVLVARLAGSTALAIADLILREAFIQPNPVRGSLAAGALRLRITGAADLRCRVFDAAGAEVAAYSGRIEPAAGVPLERIAGGADLPSGVYILRFEARVPGAGALVAARSLAFAYAR